MLLFTVLKCFFYDGEKTRTKVMELVIKKLEQIERWFTKQTKVDAVSSSILIVYDTEQQQQHKVNNNTHKSKCCCHLDHQEPNNAVDTSLQSPCSCLRSGNIQTMNDLKNERVVEESQTLEKFDVRMIDFAHIYEQDGAPRVDENYLYGVRSLLALLRKCLLER